MLWESLEEVKERFEQWRATLKGKGLMIISRKEVIKKLIIQVGTYRIGSSEEYIENRIKYRWFNG